MIRITKRFTKRTLLAVAMVAAGGLALGGASVAEARGCGGGGWGYGPGYGYGHGHRGGYGYGGYGPRAVVVSRPVVVAPPRYGYGYNAAYYGTGYRGFYGRNGGVTIGFGF